LLVDFTGTSCEVSLSDRYFMGERTVIFARYELIKVAVVVRKAQLDPQRFSETVMRNRWVDARMFTNVEDAEE